MYVFPLLIEVENAQQEFFCDRRCRGLKLEQSVNPCILPIER